MSTADTLHGAVDLHVHSAPDIDPRRFNDLELAAEAARAGMRAILVKSHQNSTVERAWLTAKAVPGIEIFGGLVLNDPVGGLNPEAVSLALKMGARQIWMPTRSAANHRCHHQQPGGIRILDDAGELIPAVREIVRQVAGTDCILGTGHLSPEEGIALMRYAAAAGVRHLLVTHPEWEATLYPLACQAELAALGVFFERCFVSTTHRCGFVPLSRIVEAIMYSGIASTVLASDLGQPDTPAPAEGMRIYAEQLMAEGFTEDQVRSMMVVNPARLLGLK